MNQKAIRTIFKISPDYFYAKKMGVYGLTVVTVSLFDGIPNGYKPKKMAADPLI